MNKDRKPQISVVMAVYNGGEFIKDSIESILQQTFDDFEFIIINDGSTDDSGDILGEYSRRDQRIQLVHQANSGLAKALNRGIGMARGKYITRQDCDDISYPQRLARQFEFLENNRTLSVCFAWTKIIDESLNEIGEFTYSIKPSKIHRTLIKGKNIYAHGSVMARKQDIINISGYDEQMVIGQDYELWLRLIRNGYKIGAVNDFLYKWRLIPESISITKYRLQKKFICIALEKNKFTMRHNIKTNRLCKNPILHYYQNIFFRNQYRLLLLKNTVKLFKNRELSGKELFKCVAAFIPISYKWLFRVM